MTTLAEIDNQICEAKKQIENLENQKFDLIRQSLYTCARCQQISPLASYIAFVNHYYEEPYSCTGGDRWFEGEVDVICPKCSTLLRPLSIEAQQSLFIGQCQQGKFFFNKIYDNIIEYYKKEGSNFIYYKKEKGVVANMFENRIRYSVEEVSRRFNIDFNKTLSYGNFINL